MDPEADTASLEGKGDGNSDASDPVQELVHHVFLPYAVGPAIVDGVERVATDETNGRQEEEKCVLKDETDGREDEKECKKGMHEGLDSEKIIGSYESRALRLCDAVDRLLYQLPLQESYFSGRCLETDANGESCEQDVSGTWNVVDQTTERLEKIAEAFRSEAERKEQTSVENANRVKSRWEMVRKFAVLSFGGALIMRLFESKKKRKNRLRRKKEHGRRAQSLKNNHMGMSRKKDLLVDRYPQISSDG